MKLLVIAYFVIATMVYALMSLFIEKIVKGAEGYATRFQIELTCISMALLWPKTVVEVIGAIDEFNDKFK